MKLLKFLPALSLIITLTNTLLAQNNSDAPALVKEGLQLNHDKKYDEAIEKYKQALKIDSGYLFADYQLAFSYSLAGKGLDGVPYLQKVISGGTSLAPSAYDLLGDIYNKNKQVDKAIATYQKGIAAYPAGKQLQYNLGLIYWGNKQYAEAEKCAAEALKIDQKYAAAQRMYALVAFHQNKRLAALMGFCDFILLQPNTAQSAEAFGNIQHIVQGGVLKPEPGEAVSHAIDADTQARNQLITQAVAENAKKKYNSSNELLAGQLKAIFVTAGPLTEKQRGDDLFRKYDAAFYYKLAQSPNMPAFACLISANTAESAKWIKDHPQQMADLDSWVKAQERGSK